jgi:putative endopeptidase
MNNLYKNINESINPGNDFYGFATGKWIDNNPQPPEYPSWGSFGALEEKLNDQVNQIIKNIISDNSNDIMIDKMKKFYNKMRNYEERNSVGINALIPYIKKIDSFDNKEELLEFLIKDMNETIFISISIDADLTNSNHYEVYLSQDLLMGNRDYYFSEDERTKSIFEKSKEVSRKLISKFGYSEKEIKDLEDVVFKYEIEIAEPAYSVEKLDKIEENYHMMNIDDASKEMNYDIRKYLSYSSLNETEQLVISQPEPIQKAFDVLNRISLEELKKYATYVIIIDNASILSDDLHDISFEFDKFYTGALEDVPKWKREINTMKSLFSENIGKMYVNKYFPEEYKNHMISLIRNIISSYNEIINEQEWMSVPTKKYALEKLSEMTYKIGYPDKWRDYSDMPMDDSKSFFEIYMDLNNYFEKKYIERTYNKDVDKSEWLMSPHTINAYYNPTSNEICFPAGILQPPFFDNNASDAVNYGAIGVVIGHEITHGFDPNGRLFTKEGNMLDWWTKEDSDKFNELTENTEEHFNSIEVIDGLKCNGELTLNENIADFGGLKIAYNALEHIMDDSDFDENLEESNGKYNWKQVFFLSNANVWAGVATDEHIKNSVMNNEHSYRSVRINGTFPMFDKWYEAWNLNKENCGLFVEQNKRAKIW